VQPGEGYTTGHHKFFRDTYPLPVLFAQGGPQTAAPLHRKSDLKAVGGFDTSLPCAQDTDINLKLAVDLRREFVVLDKVGVVLRRFGESISSDWTFEKEAITLSVRKSAAMRAIADGTFSDRAAAALAVRFQNAASELWRSGQRRLARNYHDQAKELSPRWYASYVGKMRWIARYGGFSMAERTASVLAQLHDS